MHYPEVQQTFETVLASTTAQAGTSSAMDPSYVLSGAIMSPSRPCAHMPLRPGSNRRRWNVKRALGTATLGMVAGSHQTMTYPQTTKRLVYYIYLRLTRSQILSMGPTQQS